MGITPMRGDMFMAEMREAKGSEQAGCRPVIIVQNDMGNRHSPTVIIVPLTSRKKISMPTHVDISHHSLKSDSIALCEQITTISKDRLERFLGSLPDEDMKRIDEALKISLAIRKELK